MTHVLLQAYSLLRGAPDTLVRLRVRRGGVHTYGVCLERRNPPTPSAHTAAARPSPRPDKRGGPSAAEEDDVGTGQLRPLAARGAIAAAS